MRKTIDDRQSNQRYKSRWKKRNLCCWIRLYFATVGFASENATATARVEHSVCDIEVVLDSSFPLLPYRQTQQGVGGREEGRKNSDRLVTVIEERGGGQAQSVSMFGHERSTYID